jgi:hypothetical protein
MRGVTNTTISEVNFCSGLNLGLDNRELLPPFMPVQRNQDGIFGTLLRACSGYTGFLPYMVHHQASKSRSTTATVQQPRKFALTLPSIILALAEQSLPQQVVDGSDETLIELGKIFEHWGSLALPDLQESFRLSVLQDMTGTLKDLETVLQMYQGKPDYWKKDVKARMTWMRETIASDTFLVIDDLTAACPEGSTWELSQSLIRRFGELVQIWPCIYATARRLKSDGWRPGVEV